MFCKHCGAENRDDAKFCRSCGSELGDHQAPVPRKRAGRRRIVLLVCAAVLVLAVSLAAAIYIKIAQSSELDYKGYLTVQESVDGIERKYRMDDGHHDPGRIADLLDEVEQYGLEHEDLVSSVDRGDDYVEYRLADGTLYVFMPSIEGMLSGGVDCSIVTLEPWWTDVDGVDSLRLDGDDLAIEGFTDVSGFDTWANAVAEELDEYSFVPGDNVNDSGVSLNRLRSIGRNQFVFYFGHGGSPTKAHGSFLTTGEATTKEARERYKGDLKADRLVQTSSGRLAVTDKFFGPENFGEGAFSNTDFFLLACHSCQDTRLADALLGRGARTVTGFTESVTVKYGAEMVYGILGLNEEAKGLLDVGKDGQYLTFSESIRNAQSVYGSSDTHLDFKWYESKHEPAEVVCYPEDAAGRERLSDMLVAYLDGDKDAAVNFIQEWYDDWTFSEGHDVQNVQPLILRCPPLIAENTELFDEFVESCTSMTGKYSRDFATCVVSTPQVEELDDGVLRVRVRYIGVQNTVDQAMYDKLVANPSEDVWDITVDNDNKLTSLTRVDSAGSSKDAVSSDGNESGRTDSGSYILSGTVRIHEEDFRGERTDRVVSIVLDEDVPYEYEYKGTVQAVAHEVLLASTGSDTFGADRYDEWAQYDGQHITVECDSLQGAYHDASFWNVDTIATGKIWLLNSSSQATFHVDDYHKQIERQAKGSVVYSSTGDYDGDEANEAFVVTGTHVNDLDWMDAELWFVSSSGIVSKVAGEETFPGRMIYREYEPSLGWWDNREYPPTYYGFFCVEASSGGPTSTSHAYGVRDGKAIEASFDVEDIGDVHYEESSRQVVGSVSVSLSPRKWQKYGFDFDPDAFAFKTTGAIGDPV